MAFLLLQCTHTVERACKNSHAEKQTISQQEIALRVVGTDQIGTARDKAGLEHAYQKAQRLKLPCSLDQSLANDAYSCDVTSAFTLVGTRSTLESTTPKEHHDIQTLWFRV